MIDKQSVFSKFNKVARDIVEHLLFTHNIGGPERDEILTTGGEFLDYIGKLIFGIKNKEDFDKKEADLVPKLEKAILSFMTRGEYLDSLKNTLFNLKNKENLDKDEADLIPNLEQAILRVVSFVPNKNDEEAPQKKSPHKSLDDVFKQ